MASNRGASYLSWVLRRPARMVAPQPRVSCRTTRLAWSRVDRRSGAAHGFHATERGRARMSGTRVYAIANQKGGVGKTTTAINLSACLAEAGRRTLLIDLDPQSNTTTGLGLDAHHVGLSMYELLVDDHVTAREVMKANIRPNLSLLPAKVDLYAADIELVYIQEGREFRLKKALDAVKPQFDFVLIDCPPSLGLLTVNALSAAAGGFLPLHGDDFPFEGS